MTEILRFEMNIPAEVALKYAGRGTPIEGRYGNRVMYTLADNRVMYVAPIVASRITDLGIQPGEVFHVCKQLKRQGQRRLIEWQVQRLESGPETQMEQKLRESIEVAQTAKAVQPSEATAEPNPQPVSAAQEQTAPPAYTSSHTRVPGLNGSSNSYVFSAARNGNTSPLFKAKLENFCGAPTSTADDMRCIPERAAPSIPAPTPAVAHPANGSARPSASSAQQNGKSSPPVTTKLEHALKTAISAAYNAEKYGADLGYPVRFDADAIKSMAITVLINMSEGGRR